MNTREELTRQAEKCLRQGRLDEAITQYQELAYLAPVDWGIVKQLADLLERAGQREGAARQFARWADHLFAEGFHTKSAALYKKVLKLEPSDEHALWQLGEVSLALDLRADARLAFQRAAELRQRRGDAAGAAAARDRLASFGITPTGLGTAAPTPPAYRSPSATPPVPAAEVDPPPPESRDARLVRLRLQADTAAAAGGPEAEAAWQAVLDIDPDDLAVRLRLIQAACDRGAFAHATALAAPLDAAQVPALVVLVELAYRSGDVAAIDALVTRHVSAGSSPEVVLAPVHRLAARYPDAARAALGAAVAAWLAAGQGDHAVAALEQAHGHGLLTTALLLQWVEACVDTGLPGLARAQHALAGAYITDHRFAEARAVAEDLFVRDAGAEPSLTLLLDVLAHQGVAQPEPILAGLLTPPSERADDEPGFAPLDEDTGPGEVAQPEDGDLPAWMSSVTADVAVADAEPAWEARTGALTVTPAAPGTPPSPSWHEEVPSAPAPAATFNWADLLGRDVDLDATPSAATTEAAESTPAPAAPVDAVAPAPVPAPAVLSRPAPLPPADALPAADPSPEPRFGPFQIPSLVEDAPMPSTFAMPSAWLTDAPAEHPVDDLQPPDQVDVVSHAAAVGPVDAVVALELDHEVPDDRLAEAPSPSPAPAPAQTPSEEGTALPATPVIDGSDPADAPGELPTSVPAQSPASVPVEAEAPTDGSADDIESAAALPPPPPGSPGGDSDPQWQIEEEIDLTQLLEELKQWDPVLPEPLVRPGAAAAPTPEAGAAAEGSDHAAPDDPAGTTVATTAAAVPPVAAGDVDTAPPGGSAELDVVFADLHRHSDDRAVAEQQLAAGRVFLAAGLVSEAARAFERASVEPRACFDAALALAGLHRSRGQLGEAVGWYEQAAAAAVPDAAVKRAVLYDLAESLEALGETDRALGVLLDLLSQVEDYRDARARLDRLLRVDAGG